MVVIFNRQIDGAAFCDICGHLDVLHERKTPFDPPVCGWMTCPEEGCECWKTWSIDQRCTAEEVEEMIAKWEADTGVPAR